MSALDWQPGPPCCGEWWVVIDGAVMPAGVHSSAPREWTVVWLDGTTSPFDVVAPDITWHARLVYPVGPAAVGEWVGR